MSSPDKLRNEQRGRSYRRCQNDVQRQPQLLLAGSFANFAQQRLTDGYCQQEETH